MSPEFPAGVILLLMGVLICAIPFTTRPMTPAGEARWNVALLVVSGGIIFTYAAVYVAAVVSNYV